VNTLTKQDCHGVANLVEDRSRRKGLKETTTGRGSLDDSPDHIENDRNQQEFEPAKNVRNLGCRWLIIS
jgi:hypothetical protein